MTYLSIAGGGGGGLAVFGAVRERGGGGALHGPADETAPGLRPEQGWRQRSDESEQCAWPPAR